MLHYFGYAKVPQDPENSTGFFEYDGSDEELNNVYREYERHNEEILQWVHNMTDEEQAQCKYFFTEKSKEVPFQRTYIDPSLFSNSNLRKSVNMTLSQSSWLD